jgi:hypothetical protein
MNGSSGDWSEPKGVIPTPIVLHVRRNFCAALSERATIGPLIFEGLNSSILDGI